MNRITFLMAGFSLLMTVGFRLQDNINSYQDRNRMNCLEAKVAIYELYYLKEAVGGHGVQLGEAFDAKIDQALAKQHEYCNMSPNTVSTL